MKLLVNLFILLSLQTAMSQNFTLYGDKAFGGNNADRYLQIISYSSNKLIMAGVSNSPVSGNKSEPNCNNLFNNNSDVWVVMFDKTFNLLWDKTFGGENVDDGVSSIVQTLNNEIIFNVRSESDSACDKSENNRGFPFNNLFDYWICSIDSVGNKNWDKTFGSTGIDEYPFIVYLTTGEFLIVGISGETGVSGDKTTSNWGGIDYWAVKMDSVGNKIWDRTYGGFGWESSGSGNTNYFSIVSTENGGYLIAGRTNSDIGGDISEASYGMFDIWLIKCDSSGNKIWDKRFGGSSSEQVGQIIKISDGYIIIGSTASPQSGTITSPSIGGDDVWVIKIDSVGNQVWEKRYGGTSDDFGISIAEAPGGGYLISASTTSPVGNDISEIPFGIVDYWIFKIDSVGNKLWDKRFGGPGQNFVSNFVIMPDSSIFLAGYAGPGTTAVKTDPGYGGYDYWVVHFKYSDSTVSVNDFEQHLGLTLYPNPAGDEVTISWHHSKPEDANIEIYNNLRQLVHSAFKERSYAGRNEMTISTSTFPSGIYHLRFSVAGNFVTKKLVKM